MKINFCSTEYMRSHGKLPRGYGSWGFQVVSIDGRDGEGEMHFTTAMTLTAAKRWVRASISDEALSYRADARVVDVEILP